jgi:hypothetical protein
VEMVGLRRPWELPVVMITWPISRAHEAVDIYGKTRHELSWSWSLVPHDPNPHGSSLTGSSRITPPRATGSVHRPPLETAWRGRVQPLGARV